MSTYRLIAIFGALIGTTCCLAQESSGPIVPCVGIACEGQEYQPWPETGAWYNPEQSGSGFTIEIQNGVLLAFYYGYDEEGQPTWWQFTDTLEASDEPGVVWVAEGPPNRFTGGNCFDCDFSPLEDTEQLESIRMEFLQRANMRLTLPSGAQQYMIPITYGSVERAFFADVTDHLFPAMDPESFPYSEAQGLWYFIFDNALTGEEFGPWNLQFVPLQMSPATFYPEGLANRDPGPVLRYSLLWTESPLNAVIFGRIFCELKQTENGVEPGCVYELGQPPHYDIPIGNFTDSRIQGVSENGARFEAFRAFTD